MTSDNANGMCLGTTIKFLIVEFLVAQIVWILIAGTVNIDEEGGPLWTIHSV